MVDSIGNVVLASRGTRRFLFLSQAHACLQLLMTFGRLEISSRVKGMFGQALVFCDWEVCVGVPCIPLAVVALMGLFAAIVCGSSVCGGVAVMREEGGWWGKGGR